MEEARVAAERAHELQAAGAALRRRQLEDLEHALHGIVAADARVAATTQTHTDKNNSHCHGDQQPGKQQASSRQQAGSRQAGSCKVAYARGLSIAYSLRPRYATTLRSVEMTNGASDAISNGDCTVVSLRHMPGVMTWRAQ